MVTKKDYDIAVKKINLLNKIIEDKNNSLFVRNEAHKTAMKLIKKLKK
jgi:hypothetical protein